MPASSPINESSSAESETVVHASSSSGTSQPDAGKEGTDLPASSPILRGRKGKKAAQESDSSSSDSSSSEDIEDMPTPVKKPESINRLQRGRKIKPYSSPAGRNFPTRTCYDVLFDLLFDLLYDLLFYLLFVLLIDLLFDLLFVLLMIYFLTSSGGSSANSPQSNAGVIYHDEATEKKISLLLYARLIHAVNDICPFTGENQGDLPGEYAEKKPEPFLYWKDGIEATSTLIKRYVFGVVTC